MNRLRRSLRVAMVGLVALAMLPAAAPGAALAREPGPLAHEPGPLAREPGPADQPGAGPVRPYIIDPQIADQLGSSAAAADAREPLQVLFVLADQPDPQTTATAAPDAVRASLVDTARRSQRELVTQLEQRGDRVLNTFWIQNMVLAEVRPASVVALTAVPNLARVIPNFALAVPAVQEADDPVSAQAAVTWGLERIGADRVQDELGFTGAGVTVATLDTGVAADHPDLAGKLVTDDPDDPRHPGGWMEFDGLGRPVGSAPRDSQYHGTHVSGTIHGGDASGARIGVAPDAGMMHGLVLPGGSGTWAQVAAGMQWAVAPYDATGAPAGTRANVVNMSLGASEYVAEMVQPTRNLYHAGVFPAFAVGNEVFGSCGVGSSSPGNVYEAVSVGATDQTDNVAAFSCGNLVDKRDWSDPPADWPDQWVTPDLTGPGVNVLSAEPSGSHRMLSGSSMATPHIAGTVAQLLQARPDLTVDQLRDTLRNTAFFDDRHGPDRPNPRFGWGRIDVYQAVVNATLDSGLTGRVSDRSSGDPVAGATVQVAGSGPTVTSGEDGRYELRLPPGSYQLDVARFGFADRSAVPVEVSDGQLSELDLPLTPLPTGSLAGTVSYQPTRIAVPGARVTVLGTPVDLADETDVAGGYRIDELPVGSYRVQAHAPELVDSEIVEVDVVAGRTASASFTLARPGTTDRVSLSDQGGDPNMHSTTPAISGDGQRVGFQSLANNLVDGLETPWARIQAYLRDLGSATTEILSVAPDGAPGNGPSFGVALDRAGSHAAFYSEANNLVPGDTNGRTDIFVRDLAAGTVERVSVASDGTEADGSSYVPVLSDDGRLVAFYSLATNLDGGLDGYADVFLHDRELGTTERVSSTPDGSASDGYSSQAYLSGDGRYLSFQSSATNLVEGVDTDGTYHIFVRDLQLGRTELVSMSTGGELANARSEHPKLSADGRYVTFMSESSNLIDDDTNGTYDVFVHDRVTGVTERVSVSTDGTAGNGVSDRPAISDDGRMVAFRSYASNLARGDRNNRADVFVHDRSTGRTQPVSLRTDGGFGGGASGWPDVTGDGRVVAFDSYSALVPTDGVPWQDVYLRDLAPQEPEARFALWGLSVDPPEPTWPQDVTVSAGVANIGDLAGEHELTLTVDGQPEQTATVTLGSGESTSVRWTLARRALGDYRVAVGPLVHTFTLGPPELRWEVPPVAGPRLPVLLMVLEDGLPRPVDQVLLSATGPDGQSYGPWPMLLRGRVYQLTVGDLPPGDYALSVELQQDGSAVTVDGPVVTRRGASVP